MQETADLVTFTEEILNGEFHFLCSACTAGTKFFHVIVLAHLNRMKKLFNTSLRKKLKEKNIILKKSIEVPFNRS